MIKVCRSIYS